MLTEQLKKTAALFCDRTAYIAGEQRMTYGELWRRAERTAGLLRRQGNGPVILYGSKELFMPVAMLACLICGRAYVPVDRFTPAARVQSIIASSGAALMLTETGNAFNGVQSCSPDALERYADFAPHASAGETAYIIFTSGTTGEPKGVPISVANLENFVNWLNTLEPMCGYRDAVVLNQASFSFDLSVADVFYAFTNGHTLAALENPSDTGAAFDVMRDCGVNVCVMTPTYAKLCLTDPDWCAEKYPALRCIYFCGELLEPKTVRKLWERFPELEIINAYGPTEAASAVSAVRITPEMTDSPRLPVGEIGRAAVEIAIEDDEIVLRGASVFGGYLNGPAGGYFCENGRNGYRTGDLGTIENGMLYCRGRKDSQIKYKGYRIELADIEQNIGGLPGVRDCVVIADRAGDGTVRNLTAFVVSDGERDAGRIREELKARLPAYMIPKTIRFADALPVSRNGKTDRKALYDENH